MKRQTLLMVVVTLVAVGIGWQGLVTYSKPERTRERDVRSFLRELERDLQRNWRFEFMGHVVVTEGAHSDERAHAVTDRLTEFTRFKQLRFVDVDISVAGEEALAQFTVEGYAPDNAGHLSPTSELVLLRLRQESGRWKIKDIFPQAETHPLAF